MSVNGGPNIVEDGLVLALDAGNRKGISPSANQVWNTSPQFVKNLISRSDSISALNGITLGNVQYYTAFAIDYPEGSYGGAAAGRDGITPGFNVTSGTKSFNYGRALNYAVFNNKTNSFVKTTVYDSYVGTAAVDAFVSQYNQAVIDYPDAIHIIAGSHRDSYHTAAQYNILRDLGAPSNVDSIIGFSSPEWILVGEPGLGAGNAYVWAFQNYSVNPTQVAHAVFPLPINRDNKSNYWEFDGANDSINFNYDLRRDWSFECWVKHDVVSGFCFLGQGPTSTNRGLHIWFYNNTNLRFGMYSNDRDFTLSTSTNTWYNYVFTYSHSSPYTKKMYRNGVEITNAVNVGGPNQYAGTGTVRIGSIYSTGGAYANGKFANVKLYNKVLSASEVLQNYNALKGRFDL